MSADLIARAWQAIGAYSTMICRGDADLAPPRELVDAMDDLAAALRKAEAERDRYRDVLLSRHGGEPLALLDELDQARANEEKAEAERDEARGELELASFERSSANEAATVLLTALGWKSGGLAAAAIEVVRERDEARSHLARAAEVLRHIRERMRGYSPHDRAKWLAGLWHGELHEDAIKAIDALLSDAARQEGERTQAGWISVSERLPAVNQSVALLDVNRWENVAGDWDRHIHACGYWGGSYWCVRGERALLPDAFTHWFALPDAARQEGAGR